MIFFCNILLMRPKLYYPQFVFIKRVRHKLFRWAINESTIIFDQSLNEKEYKQVFSLNCLRTILVVTVEALKIKIIETCFFLELC